MSKDYQQFFQGDVWLMKLPDSLKIQREEEIKAQDGKLILLEGEMTGHHHHLNLAASAAGFADVLERPATKDKAPETEDEISEDISEMFSSSGLGKAFGKVGTAPVAKMFKAPKTAQELVNKGILTRTDLTIGFLTVENAPMKVVHQEHSPITIGPGNYIVGRQIESVAGEERRVAD